MRELERRVVLSVLDRKWREHLYEMDYLQEGIGLRAMAQRDPLVEYQREGFDMFNAMLDAIKEESVGYLFNIEVQVPDGESEAATEPVAVDGAAPTDQIAAAPAADRPAPQLSAKGLDGHARSDNLQYSAPTLDSAESAKSGATTATATAGNEPGRNAPCPCGSGKKYKRCHGAPAGAN
jgi:preprotein translocase subunit SecA